MHSSVFGPMAVFLVSLSVASATAALAGPTPEQKCQAAKNSAAGRYAACRQSAEKTLASAGDVTKYGDAIAKCETKFADAWQKAIDGAATSRVFVRVCSPDDIAPGMAIVVAKNGYQQLG
jgi:hypothetical protein